VNSGTNAIAGVADGEANGFACAKTRGDASPAMERTRLPESGRAITSGRVAHVRLVAEVADQDDFVDPS
jgi:hypothetical protein